MAIHALEMSVQGIRYLGQARGNTLSKFCLCTRSFKVVMLHWNAVLTAALGLVCLLMLNPHGNDVKTLFCQPQHHDLLSEFVRAYSEATACCSVVSHLPCSGQDSQGCWIVLLFHAFKNVAAKAVSSGDNFSHCWKHVPAQRMDPTTCLILTMLNWHKIDQCRSVH